jgi:glycosyltransferase involved in cell wall biosynthesis
MMLRMKAACAPTTTVDARQHNGPMTLHFSIVIPTLNRRQMLQEALASVRAQQWRDTEIIVVDGGSSDGTVEELRRQGDVQLMEGPDRGLYDAFNKGIGRASGEIVAILNSDDTYPPGTFAAVAAAFGPNTDAVCGTAVIVADGRVVDKFDDDADKALTSPRTALIGSCILNARFMRRAAMAQIGAFSLDYRYVSDRDWLTRWHAAALATATIRDVVYRYRQHPGSLTFDADRARERSIREELLHLARRWRDEPAAGAEITRTAILLEGRCVAALAMMALRSGDIPELGRRLLIDPSRLPGAPLLAVVRGGLDWMRQRP